MKSLAVRVLSDFGVDGVDPQALGSRKGRMALCVLALAEGQAVPADVLVDTLWGDTPPARPEDQLAVLMSRLRSVLGRERISHRDRGYLLTCDWLDASELAALTGEMERRQQAGNVLGAAAAARVALSLETHQLNPIGLTEYLVIYGTARVTEGGAPEVLQRLAHTYLGPDVKFPPMDNPPPGYVTHIAVDRIGGVGPWAS